jgi:hypothetical protein
MIQGNTLRNRSWIIIQKFEIGTLASGFEASLKLFGNQGFVDDFLKGRSPIGIVVQNKSQVDLVNSTTVQLVSACLNQNQAVKLKETR